MRMWDNILVCIIVIYCVVFSIAFVGTYAGWFERFKWWRKYLVPGRQNNISKKKGEK